MTKEPVTFVATQYKNKPIRVSFYTEKDGKILFTKTSQIPAKRQTKTSVRHK